MKAGIYLIAIGTVFLASWNVITAQEEIPTGQDKIAITTYVDCPTSSPDNTTILIPHDTDCTKFYICLGGQKIEQVCACMNEKCDRLHFNPEKKVCDWPWDAGCQKKDFHEHQAVAMSEELIAKKDHVKIASMADESKCPDSNPDNTTVLIPHETDCTKFYTCLGGQKVEQHCPEMNEKGERLHFNPEKKVCDWPEQAGCKSKKFDEHQAFAMSEELVANLLEDQDKTLDKTYYVCPTEGSENETTLIPHEYDCTKFYICLGSQKIIQNCPCMNPQCDRLHFNPEKKVCDWPSAAGCESPTTTTTTTTTTPTTTTTTTPTTTTTTTPTTTTTTTPTPPETNDTITTTEPVPPPEDDCPQEIDGDQLPHQCNCTLYYECVNGDKVLRKCPNGLYFSKIYHMCLRIEDSDHDANCNWNNPYPHVGDCPSPTPKYPWRHEYDCRLFYKCENGKKRLHECPWGYFFDTEEDKCVHQELMTDCKNL